MKQEPKEQNQSTLLLRSEYLHVPGNNRIPFVQELEQMPSLPLAARKEYGSLLLYRLFGMREPQFIASGTPLW